MSRTLQAELLLLEHYDTHRRTLGHDYGQGRRVLELNRRSRELRAESYDHCSFTVEEMAAAYDRVGRARDMRAQTDAIRYGSRGAALTARAWITIRTRYAR
jgi:hypothetical protein